MMTRLEVNYAVSEKGVGCDVDRDDRLTGLQLTDYGLQLTGQQGLQDNGLHRAVLWATLGCNGLYWAVLGCSGLYWATLG